MHYKLAMVFRLLRPPKCMIHGGSMQHLRSSGQFPSIAKKNVLGEMIGSADMLRVLWLLLLLVVVVPLETKLASSSYVFLAKAPGSL